MLPVLNVFAANRIIFISRKQRWQDQPQKIETKRVVGIDTYKEEDAESQA